MNQHFTHLHLHSEFSLLDGAIRVKDAIKFAKEHGMRSMAITDHGNVFGGVKFFQEAAKASIKPILGVEMYLTRDATIRDPNEKYFHLIILVMNKKGYENLCQLMSFAYTEGFYFKPRIDYKVLEQFNEGLIVGTACLGGHIPKLLRHGKIEEAYERIEWFIRVFGRERFYLEVAPAGNLPKQQVLNDLLFEVGQKFDLRVVASSDAHYLREDDHEAHEVMLSIQTKGMLTDEKRFTFGDFRGFLKTTEQMLAAFPNNPEVVWNSGLIADQCDFNFEFGKLLFPICQMPEGETEQSYFSKLSHEGLEKLIARKLINPEKLEIYQARLTEEIDLIGKMGFSSYFLIVSDFMRWAKRQDIPIGPGRGSAAGSLVAWALEITNIDPLQYNLLFERFLNPERVSMPDIDIDFCIERREEVINYVREKYGSECVCQIITFGTMMAKGVVKDVARVLGFPFQDANAITDLVPDQLKITLAQAIEQEPRLAEMIKNNPKISHLFDICRRLEGLTRHASKHAAGVVISPRPLREVIPLYVPSKSTDTVTQYAMTELESLGFLKMDFLGLKNLTVIDRTVKMIKKNYNISIDLDLIPFNDKATFDNLGAGNTTGVFQFEGDGVTEIMKRFKPDKFEDLIALNALYRPGPLGSGMVDDYIERRHGRKPVEYSFPALEPVLVETYGIIAYQEQVQKLAVVVAGYSLGGADILRRAMGKKKPEEMAKQKAIFLAGAAKNGFDTKKSEDLFELMAYFADYGFNKSHSAAYAKIAYQTAYLKTHYPNEFHAAILTFEVGNPDHFSLYLERTRTHNIKISPPNINESDIEFLGNKNGVIFGLNGIKNVGLAALHNILEVRAKKPFSDILEFCIRVDLRTVNKRVVESLISAGAMDCLPGNRAQKTAELETILARAHQEKDSARTGQMGLFGKKKSADSIETYEFAPLDEWPIKQQLDLEKEIIGLYLSAHPLDNYRQLSSWIGSSSLAETPTKKTPIVTVGLLLHYKTVTTKKGDRMAFAELESLTGKCELIIFPRTFAECEEILKTHTIFVVQGTCDPDDSGTFKVIVDQCVPADEFFERKIARKLHLELPELFDDQLCQDLKTQLSAPGQWTVNLSFSENEKSLGLAFSQQIACSQQVLSQLETVGVTPRIEFEERQKPAFNGQKKQY